MSRGRALVLSACLALVPATAAAQVRDWPSERPPRPLPAREVTFPPYSVKTLANGLQVIAVSQNEQPAVSLRLIVRAGGALDPADKPGVATLAAALLDQGTASKDAEQIASAVDSIGGALGTGAGSDLSFVNAIVMKDGLGFALDMVSDLVRHPAFAPEEIERQREQMISGLKVSYDDPDYLAGVVFDRLVYGVHPYGRPDTGTAASIASITRQDLLAFHKAWYGANNAILAIVGDVTPEEAFAGAERAFGSWEKASNTAPATTEPPPPTRRVIVIDRPGAVQTEIRVGNLALPRKHQDYLALDLAIKILGGEGGNRLQRVLRSERGLTYGASADTNALRDAGDVVADTDTRTETTGEALRLMVEEFWRIQRERVSERELQDAQAYLTGSFPLTIETPSAIALQVLNAVFYGLDLDELQTFRERVNAVTPDDIQRVARLYLRPDRLSIVLVGDASAFAKQLPGAGFGEFERIPLADLDLAAMDFKRRAAPSGRLEPPASPHDRDAPARLAPASSQAVPPGPQPPAGPTAQALIDRAITAKGGAARLRAVKTVRATATFTVTVPNGQPADLETTTSIQYPGSFRSESKMPAGIVVQVFHNGGFWVKTPEGTREQPQPVANEMRANIQRDSIGLLVGLLDKRLTAVRVADVAVGGRSMPAVEVRGATMPPLTLIFDPATALIVRQRYRVIAAPGTAPLETEEEFSDFRDVGGIKVPFNVVVRANGVVTVKRVAHTVEYNVPLDPALFTFKS
ncbi:MAG: pitrilysin family protein [Vicinamibacterales bacterium]